MWDLIVSVPDHCLSFYFMKIEAFEEQTVMVASMVASHFIPRSFRTLFFWSFRTQ